MAWPWRSECGGVLRCQVRPRLLGCAAVARSPRTSSNYRIGLGCGRGAHVGLRSGHVHRAQSSQFWFLRRRGGASSRHESCFGTPPGRAGPVRRRLDRLEAGLSGRARRCGPHQGGCASAAQPPTRRPDPELAAVGAYIVRRRGADHDPHDPGDIPATAAWPAPATPLAATASSGSRATVGHCRPARGAFFAAQCKNNAVRLSSVVKA
jgi:hypothetical protein